MDTFTESELKGAMKTEIETLGKHLSSNIILPFSLCFLSFSEVGVKNENGYTIEECYEVNYVWIVIIGKDLHTYLCSCTNCIITFVILTTGIPYSKRETESQKEESINALLFSARATNGTGRGKKGKTIE